MVNSLWQRLRADWRKPRAGNTNFWANSSPIPLLLTLLVWGILGWHFRTSLPQPVMAAIAITCGWVAYQLFKLISLLVAYGTRALPNHFYAAMGGGIGALITAYYVGFRWPMPLYASSAFLALWVNVLVVGAATWLWRRPAAAAWVKVLAGITLIGGLALDGLGLYSLIQAGKDPFPIKTIAPPALPLLSATGLTNPGTPGNLAIDSFTYGSGTDRWRPEFASEVRYKTETVDATRLLRAWTGKKKKWRERYWGFGVEKFPLNGRVWLPQGEGPFPIILIVHGNHGMEDYSDGGYGYLGRLLASQGYLTVSVDENFLNGTWSGDFRGAEMPTRAWMLLQHLQQWRRWNQDSTHPLAGKADLNKVILIGHSRGGEAVSIAAAYNQLPCFPDDCQEAFDFGFGIQGLVAIAPTDQRYFRRVNLQDVSYLTLQGSYDSDEASFFGRRQYQRISFTPGTPHLKAGVYIHRANHGQFNTTWGRWDSGVPYRWLLNTQPLLSGEEQRQFAEVLIPAFAAATLRDDTRYRDLLANPLRGSDWLPASTRYLANYADAHGQLFASFEEDLLLTAAPNGVQITGEHLNLWREEPLKFRDKEPQNNQALVLGWKYPDSSRIDTPAVYSFIFRDTSIPLVSDSAQLLLTVAAGNPKDLLPERGKKKDKSAKPKDKKKDEAPVDFTLILEDSLGNQATLVLSAVHPPLQRLQTSFFKTEAQNKNMGDTWEPTWETLRISLSAFQPDAGFDFSALRALRIRFDRSQQGILYLDDVGFSE